MDKKWVDKFNEERRAPPVYFDPEKLFDWDDYQVPHPNRRQARKMLRLFWWCSLEDRWDVFPFQELFSVMRRYTRKRLEQMKGRKKKTRFMPSELRGKIKEAREAFNTLDLDTITREQYEYLMGVFGRFTPHPRYNMLRIYWKTTHPPKRLTEKILLTDEIIHLEHDKGVIWNISIPKQRGIFERKYGVRK